MCVCDVQVRFFKTRYAPPRLTGVWTDAGHIAMRCLYSAALLSEMRFSPERTERKVEIKKPEKASLDSRRPVFLMLGLVMALATLYVALEFNTSSGNMSGDASQFDDMQDLDLMPALDRSDMIAAAPSGAPAKPTPKNVKVVDEVKKQLERNATINTLRDAQGEGEGGANGE